MSLYQLSKLLFELNRSEEAKQRFQVDPAAFASGYSLSEEERGALLEPDIGLLYVLGVNGQILMHYAALRGIEWSDYLQRMRDGVKQYGPVRAGIYAMTTSPDEKVAG
ncbi:MULTISPECIES: aromatic ring-opening dioxygenase LigA [unclassified Sphingomonas]|uniref:aromatic ring-opening dioxygenase LigA n=1 Tax=unclassified Sphingomonas TaxID=196159 RepID=UPI0006F6EA56|nr:MULTISPECIES: aromatic ring-opening dioxygenase LigA [unclassified Sphingomonas]KQX19130.1 aromatic ring-opening dioxygenase LigA [Sphingomonas sp. Root1294]KQY65331.1 aromatic ring-opening dioxygenase LigA [Sphingomonas sp. Root50]KRB95374.1 aromatic ring-opening dioxygenase LigA [Sphingomonas sp. Root720]